MTRPASRRGADLLIRGARVIDGCGNPWFHGDVAVAGARIAAIAPPGALDASRAREVVDADGRVVCPGFIDLQSHSILPLLDDGRSWSKVAQGVTTEAMGESWTPAPFGGRIDDPFRYRLLPAEPGAWATRAKRWRRLRGWLRAMVRRGVAVNIGSYVGGGTLRAYACGGAIGAATRDEVAAMARVMDEAMRDGAFGLASALIYPPGSYAGTEELIAAMRAAARLGGSYITHVRSEDERLVESIAEAIAIGRAAGCAVDIYHLKALGRAHWHRLPAAIAAIEAARADGVDVCANMYPYDACCTNAAVLLPDWAAEGGRLFDALDDASARARIRAAMAAPTAWNADLDAITLHGPFTGERAPWAGRTLGAVARERGGDWRDLVIDLLRAERQLVSCVFALMSEDNLRAQVRLPWISFSTDAGGIAPTPGAPPCHPRAYGTYPRVLARFVRELGVLTWEDAIRKMTSAPAARLRLRDRSALRVGAFADLVLLDPATVADRATYGDPHRAPVGIDGVWTNGVRVWRDGAHTGAMPGRIVDGPGRGAAEPIRSTTTALGG